MIARKRLIDTGYTGSAFRGSRRQMAPHQVDGVPTALSTKTLKSSHRSAEDRPSPDAPPGQIRRMTAPRNAGSRSSLFT